MSMHNQTQGLRRSSSQFNCLINHLKTSSLPMSMMELAQVMCANPVEIRAMLDILIVKGKVIKNNSKKACNACACRCNITENITFGWL